MSTTKKQVVVPSFAKNEPQEEVKEAPKAVAKTEEPPMEIKPLHMLLLLLASKHRRDFEDEK